MNVSFSWEPTENVEGCERLLKSFWNHIGVDNEDYEEGYVVEASPEWVGKWTSAAMLPVWYSLSYARG